MDVLRGRGNVSGRQGHRTLVVLVNAGNFDGPGPSNFAAQERRKKRREQVVDPGSAVVAASPGDKATPARGIVAEHQAPCRRIVVPRCCLRRWPSQVTLRGRNAHRGAVRIPATQPREVLPCQQRPRVSDQAFEFGPHALASWKTPASSRDYRRRGRLRGVERGVNPGQRTREAAPEPPASSEGPGDPILDFVK
ncbi:hypothetical protein HPB50_002704 [Hyalomma asiaticum]|uniref:Uncharacterized protein n=1 Tax=Hyalomma asiaticum TaxID=266040 RepID=A0ACB7TDY1_HYAAI|nr:hypothetical protein HPB50_002704 [Hyalomma asiaticum]